MDTKKLRQKILDLAIRGKLVPQDPNDEPASVLLERIRAEKEQLIKEGKIKRTKKSNASDTSHYENVPFEVPAGWVWVKLSDICVVARGGSPRPIKEYLTDNPDGVNWIKIGDTDKDGKYINSTKEKIRPEGVSKSRMVHKGNFLLTNSMSFGRPYILNVDGCIHDGWLAISPLSGAYDTEFLYYLLSSNFAFEQFAQTASGGVVSNLNSDKVSTCIFPLPPLAEQRRIVEKINVWLKVIEGIANDSIEIQSQVQQLKTLILDSAITGKLVRQNLDDEPAIELLKKVNPEYKPCDNRHYENIPFELPETWLWVTLSDISNYGECANVSVDKISNESWVLELEDIEKDSGRLLQRMRKSDRTINGVRHSFQKGDVLYSKLRTYLNKVLVADQDGYCTTEIIPITCVQGIVPEYLCHVLRSKYYVDYTISLGYGVKMPRLGTGDALKSMIPVPPYEEQRRIVKSVNEIYHKLEQISSEL